MLPKKNRLKKKKEIKRVFQEGKRYKEDFLVLKLTRNNFDVSRFVFIISQKVAKKAVLRNKIKRRLGESVRNKLFEIKIGFDAAIIVQPGFEDKNFQDIEKNVESLFKKAKLYRIS